MPIEDDLFNVFKHSGFGKAKGVNVNQLLATLVRNSQIGILKTLRQEIDRNIKRLQIEAGVSGESGSYDPSLDPYKILGVSMDATREEIDKAYKKKAWTAHPDHGGSNEEMIRVNAAYEAIRQFRGWK